MPHFYSARRIHCRLWSSARNERLLLSLHSCGNFWPQCGGGSRPQSSRRDQQDGSFRYILHNQSMIILTTRRDLTRTHARVHTHTHTHTHPHAHTPRNSEVCVCSSLSLSKITGTFAQCPQGRDKATKREVVGGRARSLTGHRKCTQCFLD